MYIEIKLMKKFRLIQHCTATSEHIPVNEFTYRVSEKYYTLFIFFPLGAQCVESGVSCTDCY